MTARCTATVVASHVWAPHHQPIVPTPTSQTPFTTTKRTDFGTYSLVLPKKTPAPANRRRSLLVPRKPQGTPRYDDPSKRGSIGGPDVWTTSGKLLKPENRACTCLCQWLILAGSRGCLQGRGSLHGPHQRLHVVLSSPIFSYSLNVSPRPDTARDPRVSKKRTTRYWQTSKIRRPTTSFKRAKAALFYPNPAKNVIP